ncbi:unnamed protein product [Ilex paraguariensis]|uniref:Uncharacterized protein n=1 Tax=Ilex paraguariensis TaxID=185542 RepID=A0ABC8RQS1_9AQUA
MARTVIKTKSVEYMPFFLSLFLLLNAGCWFTLALLLKDHYVIVANAIGIVSGSAQLIIYMIYKDKSSLVESEKTEVKEASIHKLEEGIKAQDMNEFDEGKLKSRSATLPKPSISRAYTINKLMRSVSMSQYESHSTFLLVP